ncbi:MAG: hypothetical protein HY537_14100, partial [Deltaproteobacteria bacterium]|nr:hypothetical protein [Deltaproteobacteria bacterium]
NISQLEVDGKKLLTQREELIGKRDVVVKGLDSEVATLYRRLTSRLKGVAVVEVESGTCLGCHMRIRPQMYNEVIGYQAIHRCPNCGKIMISVSKDEDEQNPPAQ